ncbi:kinase-like domain-containing protein [Xylaria digitata]|nr:kinase-like domain-containing protein [Xylaria digitata]
MTSLTSQASQPGQEAVSNPSTKASEKHHKQRYIQPYGAEGIENLEDYRENGLHPVEILDILDGRFEVCHKLGSGGIATVWLCYETAKKRWRAIKVNAASHSSIDSPELRISKLFQDKDIGAEQLERHHIVMAEETATFWIEGHNGKHLCSILPVLGPSLSEWRDLAVGFDAVQAKKVGYEITEGLHFLHEHGICHGDLRPQNILMRLSNGGLDHMDPDDLFQLISLHTRHEVRTIDGNKSLNAPKWVIEPLNWFELKDLVLDDVAIVDFGEAFETTSPPSSLGIPRPYASPEVTYGGAPLGKESDMWSLAITLMEIRTGEQLDGFESPLSRMESIAGPIPPPYRSIAAEELYQEKLDEFKAYGQEDEPEPRPPSEKLLKSTRALTELFWMESQAEGEIDYSSSESPTKIEDYLGEELWEKVLVPKEDNIEEGQPTATLQPYRIPTRELTMLADLLRGMLKYEPRDRTKISSVLEHPWFKIELEDKKIVIEELGEQLLGSESKGADTPKETYEGLGRPGGQPRIKISYNQILSWSHISLPILLSLIILWKLGWGTESVMIKNLEVVNIVVAPTQPWADTNQR